MTPTSPSNQTGKVTAHWSARGRNNSRALTFDWKETDGPAVREPAKKGFGGTLI